MYLFGVTALSVKLMLEGWNWGHTPDLPFTSTISVVMTWCPLKTSCTRH